MLSKGPPGSFQPEDDDSYRESRLRSSAFVRYLRNYSKTTEGSCLASRLDVPEYKEAQSLQKDSSPPLGPPKSMNI